MYASEILKKTKSVQGLFSRFDERLQKKDAEDPTIFQYEDFLPCFSLMCQISNRQNEEQMLKIGQITDTLRQLQTLVVQLEVFSLKISMPSLLPQLGVSDLSESIAKSLQKIVDSSQMVVHLLNRVTRISTIPLHHEHHEHFLQIIKNCLQIANDRANWSGNASSVNWPMISSSLKSVVNKYKEMTEFLDSSIQENRLLQLSTMKMLNQTAEFCLH